MRFTKMHGLGNDFVILDARKEPLGLSKDHIMLIADRHFGVGCDTLVVLEPSQKGDVFARYYNADGSESGACGNATRCVADIVMKEKNIQTCNIEVGYGLLPCRHTGNLEVEVDMGAPRAISDLDLSHGGLQNPVIVDMGNPHCVFFVDNIVDIPVETLGAYFETHAAFPHRTNVEFAEIQSRSKIRLRTWERGSGLTLACGSGACATTVAAVQRGFTDRIVEIEVDGGTLYMEGRAADNHVLMRGAVAYVFEGVIAEWQKV